MLLKNFVYAATKTLFQEQLSGGSITNDAIAFIADSGEIWTHGKYFATQLTTEEIETIVTTSKTIEEFIKQISPVEVAISTSEPVNDEKIWIDPSDAEDTFVSSALPAAVTELTSSSSSEDIIDAFGGAPEFNKILEQVRNLNSIGYITINNDSTGGRVPATVKADKAANQLNISYVDGSTLTSLVVFNSDGVFNCVKTETAIGEAPDLSNYLAKDNITEFTPTEDYNPATKKYVDDKTNILVTNGDGNSFLANDGTYKAVTTTESFKLELPSTSGTLDEEVQSNLINAIENGDRILIEVDGNEFLCVAIDYLSSSDYLLAQGYYNNYYNNFSLTKSTREYTITSAKNTNESEVLTKTNTVEFTPDSDYEPATKKYVDDAVAGSTGTNEVTISDTEPTDDSDIWIDTSKDYPITDVIGEAPIDGNEYVRKDGAWVQSTGVSQITETLKVNLTSNQTNPNSDLNGVVVTVTYSDITRQETWNGSELTFTIPMGQHYIVSGSAVNGYATPANIEHDSVVGETRNVTLTYNTTLVTVNRACNQEGRVTDCTATLSYGETNEPLTFSSGVDSQIVKVPTGTQFTVSFSAVEGYRAPVISSTTATGATQSVTGTYEGEQLIVNVEGVSSGYTITVSGVGSQTTSTQTYMIPYGTEYTVSASAVSGYTAPSNQSFIAGQVSRTVAMTYAEIVNGIFIYDNSGGLTAVNSWNTSNNANAAGVAVITDNCRFAISKSLPMVNNIQWSSALYGTDVDGILTTTSQTTAITDYAGQSNTDIIRTQASGENSSNNAAHYCYEQTLNSQHGYLPSAGELAVMYNNKSNIDNALVLIGSKSISDRCDEIQTQYAPWFWSSTEYSTYYAWNLFWEYSPLSFRNYFKNRYTSNGYAFPVFPLT